MDSMGKLQSSGQAAPALLFLEEGLLVRHCPHLHFRLMLQLCYQKKYCRFPRLSIHPPLSSSVRSVNSQQVKVSRFNLSKIPPPAPPFVLNNLSPLNWENKSENKLINLKVGGSVPHQSPVMHKNASEMNIFIKRATRFSLQGVFK